MGKFCTRCGRPLQEGEVCNCASGESQNTVNGTPQEQAQTGYQAPPVQPQGAYQTPPVQPQGAYQAPPVQPQMGYQMPPQGMGQPMPNAQAQAAKELASQVKGNFMSVLTKPVTEGRKVIATANVKMAVIFFILQGIASALFALAVGTKYYNMMIGKMGLVGGIAGGVLPFPYGKVVFVTLIVSVAHSCILALLLWSGHAILKCETTYPKMMSAAAIRSAMMVPTILAALVLFEIKPTLGFFLFVMGNIWGFLTMTTAMDSHIPDTKKDIFPLVVSIVILLFVVICMFIMSKAWLYYLPGNIRAVLSTAINQDWGSLMKELLDSLSDFDWEDLMDMVS